MKNVEANEAYVPVEPRLEFGGLYKMLPKAAQGLIAFSNGAAEGLDKTVVHLVKIRASQMNGCAFCIAMHIQEAQHDGIEEPRLHLLSAWREMSFFTAKERAALEWTERLTALGHHSEDDEIYTRLQEHFSDVEIVHLTGVIAGINAWNRFGVGLRLTPQFS